MQMASYFIENNRRRVPAFIERSKMGMEIGLRDFKAWEYDPIGGKPFAHATTGFSAPDAEFETIDHEHVTLEQFKGKWLLIEFGASWCGPCVAETPNMKATYDAYGSNPKFVMISLSLDQQTELPQKFARTHDIKWVQGFLGDWSKDTVTKDYSVRGIPSIFLIGPDGKIVAQNLRGEGIKAAVAGVLN